MNTILAPIFSDGMVLQRDRKFKIFGVAATDDIITVEIDNIREKQTLHRSNKAPWNWEITLPAHPAGGPFEMKITIENQDSESDDKGQNHEKPEVIIIHDIYFGEVWLNNGQSNIEFELINEKNGQEELERADYPMIRYLAVPAIGTLGSELGNAEKDMSWKSVTGKNFGNISAIGYYYAVMLYEKLQVPVGIIDCYKGGTSISCWLERSRLEKLPEGSIYLEEYDTIVNNQTEEEYQQILSEYNDKIAVWEKTVEEMKAENPDVTPEEIFKTVGPYLWPPPLGTTSEFRPCGLVETMLKRVAPYTINGIIYYQGEEDAIRNFKQVALNELNDDEWNILRAPVAGNDFDDRDSNKMYKSLLNELICEFRDFFEDSELPVVIIQLPMFLDCGVEDEREWAYLREAQQGAALDDHNINVYFVPMLDMGEYGNIHPVNKKTPGERTGRIILRHIYNIDEYVAGSLYPVTEQITYRKNGCDILVKNEMKGLILMENELVDLREEMHSGISKSSEKETEAGNLKSTEKETELDKSESTQNEHVYGLEILTEEGEWVIPQSVRIDWKWIHIKDTRGVYGVRYGFFNYGKVNIYNSDGMPLVQIRDYKK